MEKVIETTVMSDPATAVSTPRAAFGPPLNSYPVQPGGSRSTTRRSSSGIATPSPTAATIATAGSGHSCSRNPSAPVRARRRTAPCSPAPLEGMVPTHVSLVGGLRARSRLQQLGPTPWLWLPVAHRHA